MKKRCVEGSSRPDDPPVDDADAPVAQQHHVAGVHVAVEGAPAHRGEEEGPHHLLHQRGGIEAEVGHPGQVVDGHAVEELHRQHVAARELGVGLGHRHQLQVELVLQAAEVRQRARLVAQVHLLADLHPEAVEQLQRGAGHLVAGLAHQDLEQRLHEVEVGGHHVLDVGPQHLDRHRAPVEEAGPVHHGDGGRPDRVGLELGERVAQRQAEVLLHPLAHVGERHRRARVEAGAELVGHVVAEHAGRRGDDLAELHEGPAEVLEALAQRPGQLRRRQRALADGAQLAEGGRGEVDRHHLGDGPAAPQQLAVRRVGQAPRVDARHVLGQRARHRAPASACTWRVVPTGASAAPWFTASG